MHCKVELLRRIIKETILDDDPDFAAGVIVVRGTAWMKLEFKRDMQRKDQVVLFHLEAQAIENINSHRDEYMREINSGNLDEDRLWAYQYDVDKLTLSLARQDQEGFISVEPTSYRFIDVTFNDPALGKASLEVTNLWVPVPVDAIDWRPNEPLPEDYYAL